MDSAAVPMVNVNVTESKAGQICVCSLYCCYWLCPRSCVKSQSVNEVSNLSEARRVSKNEMDTHTDTCYAVANWVYGHLLNMERTYLLVGDQMLWFGTQLPSSLLNLDQLCAYGVDVNDVQCDEAFIPCEMMGTIVHFKTRVETRVPNEWEIKHLSILLLTGDEWNQSDESMCLERKSCE